jgi:hypothetical protein
VNPSTEKEGLVTGPISLSINDIPRVILAMVTQAVIEIHISDCALSAGKVCPDMCGLASLGCLAIIEGKFTSTLQAQQHHTQL